MTANKQYKEYKKTGGTLGFTEWINREKKKGFVNFDGSVSVPQNTKLTDSLNNVISDLRKKSGYKETVENKYIFGVHKSAWISVGIIGLCVAGYVVYKNKKK